MEKFYFTNDEYYGRVIPYIQEITDSHNIDESSLYNLESDKNEFNSAIFSQRYFQLKSDEEFLNILKTEGSKFKIELETWDTELIITLEKISKGEKI